MLLTYPVYYNIVPNRNHHQPPHSDSVAFTTVGKGNYVIQTPKPYFVMQLLLWGADAQVQTTE